MLNEENFESVLSEEYKNLEGGEERLHGNIKEEVFLPEIGTRDLTDDQISSLWNILNYIFNGAIDFDTINKMAKKVAVLLIENEINFESALNLWTYLQADIEILNNVYANPKENQINLSFAEILSQNGESIFDPKIVKKTESDVKKIIQLPKHFGMITASMGSKSNLVLDPKRKRIYTEKISYHNGEESYDETLVIDACLDKLTVIDSPLDEEMRKFNPVFITHLKDQPISIGPGSITEIYNFLLESGYVINSRFGKDVLTMTLNTYIQIGEAEVKTEIENPGFFYNKETDEILAVKFTVKDVSTDKLKESLMLLEEFVTWFPDQDKTVSVFKWGLIAPFIFAMKQRGADVQWIFLFGRGGTGKTTNGKMVLYLWGQPDENNDIGGSHFDTEYRIGNRLQQSTFPIVVNEPGEIFEKIKTRDMLKTASQQTTSRGKQLGGRYITIPAFAPVIFTSNQPLPSIGDDQEALARRLLIESFGYDETKSKEEREKFRKTFDIKNTKNCSLHGLKPLAHFAANEIINNPTLLDLDWKELADTLILRICSDIGIDVPKWLQGWSEMETLDDLDDIQRERVRTFLQSEINNAYGRIQILDEHGQPKTDYKNEVDVKTADDFKHRVWTVLNERKIPWALLDSKNKVHLTSGFVEAVRKDTGIKDNMSMLAELLHWKHGSSTVRGSVNWAGKNITVTRDEFTEFIFPTICNEVCEMDF